MCRPLIAKRRMAPDRSGSPSGYFRGQVPPKICRIQLADELGERFVIGRDAIQRFIEGRHWMEALDLPTRVEDAASGQPTFLVAQVIGGVAATLTVGLAAGRFKGPYGARLDAHLRQLLELASAVADLLGRHAQDIQERELQVRRRRVFWIDEMTAALEGAAATADDEGRERTVCVTVTVADARSVQNDQVVEQRAIAVGSVA